MTVPVAVLDTASAELAATVRAAAGPGLDLRFAATADAAGFAEVLRGVRHAVVRGVPMPAALLDAAPDLALIHQWGTGTDNIPVAQALARGITVARSPGRNAPSVADMTLGLMLAVLRRIPAADAAMRAGGWKMDALWSGGRDLGALRVGLVGFGAIGQAVARRLDGFGAEVVYYRPSGPHPERDGWLPLAELIATSDLISLHMPHAPGAGPVIGAAQIAAMKPGAVIVNTARGALIDEAAMTEALARGRLGGLGLDVFATEPLPAASRLARLPNTVLTPHVAGRTEDNLLRMVRHWAGNIRAHAAGAPIPPADLVLAG